MEHPFWTIIVAAGCGQRFGTARPKQYLELAGRPVLMRAMDPFLDHGDPDRIILVIPPEDGDFIKEMLDEYLPGARPLLVPGGSTRQNSVYRGLSAIADDEGWVAVHDAARPLFDGAKLEEWKRKLEECDAVLPVLPIADTVVEARDGRVSKLLDRRKLGAVQTPQLFRLSTLRAAHLEAIERGEENASDDGGLVLALGAEVCTVPGDTANFKITRPEDFEWAQRELEEKDD